MIQMSSFISSFRKSLKRIGMVAAVMAAGAGICCLLDYLYVEEYEWGRRLWHDYYNEEENIDNLYLGSSHVYRDLDPYLLDELNGENNFHLATGSQRLKGSYYLLKEADKKHDLKHVYVEVYYYLSTEKLANLLVSGQIANWRNTDNMKFSLNRLEYMFAISGSEQYLDTFFPFIRYRSRLFDLGYIKTQIQVKSSEAYKNYEQRNQYEWMDEYVGKGYWYSTKQLLNTSLYFSENPLGENPLSDEAETYLRKIIEYCKKRNIEITLFSSPIYELQVLSAENYDAYVRQIQAIADEYETEYYDFNLCKEEYLPIQHGDYFIDVGHLNASGAQMFTALFYQVMQGTQNENKKYFFASYQEKCRMSEPNVYGILKLESQDDKIYLKAASNRMEGMEYRILITPDESDTIMIQEFDENPYFSVPADEHGICTIVARETGKEEVHTIEVKY